MRRLCIHHLKYDLQNLRMMQGGSEYPLESIEEVDLHDVVAQVKNVYITGFALFWTSILNIDLDTNDGRLRILWTLIGSQKAFYEAIREVWDL